MFTCCVLIYGLLVKVLKINLPEFINHCHTVTVSQILASVRLVGHLNDV